MIEGKRLLAPWILPLGALGMMIGLAIMGKECNGYSRYWYYRPYPSRGFAVNLPVPSRLSLHQTGLPISTTQTLVGAVLVWDSARGIAALNLGVIRNIVISWVITLPVGAVLSLLSIIF